MRRWCVAALAVATTLVASTPTEAVTQEQAVAAANAGRDVSQAAVYATPAPLRKGSRVVEAGPGAWTVGQPRRDGRDIVFRLRPSRVRRAAWLVWQDLAPGAGFAHP